jgi:hypothetical protein
VSAFSIPITQFSIVAPPIYVHIIKVQASKMDKKSVHIQNQGVFVKEGCKTSKIRSGGPEGVQFNRLFIKEGCSQREVSLYIYI